MLHRLTTTQRHMHIILGGKVKKRAPPNKKRKSAAREKPSSLKNVCEKWPKAAALCGQLRCECASVCKWNSQRVLAK